MLLQRKTVLVVEDEESISRLIQLNLEAASFEVLTAADGLEALEIIRTRKPDLVVLDIYMPRMDGWDVLWELRHSEPTRTLPVVVLTVDSSPQSVLRGWREGADCFLTKPFDPHDLITLIERILGEQCESVLT